MWFLWLPLSSDPWLIITRSLFGTKWHLCNKKQWRDSKGTAKGQWRDYDTAWKTVVPELCVVGQEVLECKKNGNHCSKCSIWWFSSTKNNFIWSGFGAITADTARFKGYWPALLSWLGWKSNLSLSHVPVLVKDLTVLVNVMRQISDFVMSRKEVWNSLLQYSYMF